MAESTVEPSAAELLVQQLTSDKALSTQDVDAILQQQRETLVGLMKKIVYLKAWPYRIFL